jgi:hypothetical protein
MGAQQPWPDPLPPQFCVATPGTGSCNQAPSAAGSLLLPACDSSLVQLQDSPLPPFGVPYAGDFPPLACTSSDVQHLSELSLPLLSLFPKFLWRRPRRNTPRMFLPFLKFAFQQQDLKVPFPRYPTCTRSPVQQGWSQASDQRIWILRHFQAAHL